MFGVLLNWLIIVVLWVPPLRWLIQALARRRMFARAAEHGWTLSVPWTRDQMQLKLEQLERKETRYPAYYRRQYHGYWTGNLSFKAALESTLLSPVASLNAYPELGRGADAFIRAQFVTDLWSFGRSMHADDLWAPRRILDFGCGAGLSTETLVEAFPNADICAIDLSPYMLVVAALRHEEELARQAAGKNRGALSSLSRVSLAPASPSTVRFLHADVGCTGLPSSSADLVVMYGLCHELPAATLVAVLAEARRLLVPGGVLAISDIDPRVLFALPRPVFLLFASTEPDINDYLACELRIVLQMAGFGSISVSTAVNRRLHLYAVAPPLAK